MAGPQSVQQFAATVRAKFPGAYDDLSDADLTSKITTKYPQYKDMVQSAPQTPTLPVSPVGLANQALHAQNPGMQVSGAEQNPRRQSFVNSPALDMSSAPHSRPANSAPVAGALSAGLEDIPAAAQSMAEFNPADPRQVYGAIKGAVTLPARAGT